MAVLNIGLHAHVRIYPLQPPVLLANGLHLADQRRIHSAILRPPRLERRAAHAMFTAQLGNRHTAFGMPQDRNDLRHCVSACLHSESLPSSWREKSTHAAHYFRGVASVKVV